MKTQLITNIRNVTTPSFVAQKQYTADTFVNLSEFLLILLTSGTFNERAASKVLFEFFGIFWTYVANRKCCCVLFWRSSEPFQYGRRGKKQQFVTFDKSRHKCKWSDMSNMLADVFLQNKSFTTNTEFTPFRFWMSFYIFLKTRHGSNCNPGGFFQFWLLLDDMTQVSVYYTFIMKSILFHSAESQMSFLFVSLSDCRWTTLTSRWVRADNRVFRPLLAGAINEREHGQLFTLQAWSIRRFMCCGYNSILPTLFFLFLPIWNQSVNM